MEQSRQSSGGHWCTWENLFGDQVSYYSGALTFTQTDIDLPGNNALPVRVTRTHSTSPPEGPTAPGMFGEWDLDIPYISGVFARNTGWKSSDPAGDRSNRCSVHDFYVSPPTANADVGSGISFGGADYWRGNHLVVPGAGDQMLLRPLAGAPQPNDGNTYPWVTLGHWRIRCLNALASGDSGEGFLALSPDGSKYFFDWMVVRPWSTLTKTVSTTPFLQAQLNRDEIRLYPTRIEDRFGNFVTYAWNANDTLQSITASDGRSITFTYHTSFIDQIQTATAHGRTWTYNYSTSQRLSSVLLPDNSTWGFNTTSMLVIYQNLGAVTSCNLGVWNSPPRETYTFTHPSGAVGVFDFDLTRHFRDFSAVDPLDRCHIEDGHIEAGPMSHFDNYALARKTITGNGLPSLQWTINYPATATNPIKTVIASKPDASQSRFTFGTVYYNNEGKLLVNETRDAASIVLRSETNTYETAPPTPSYAYQVGTSYVLDAFPSEFQVPEKSSTISQQGRTFANTITGFDNFARPLSSTQASSLGFSRSTAQSYEDNTALWVLGLPKTQTVDGITVAQTDYFANALPQFEYSFGELQRTNAFNADGTLATIKDGRDNLTTLSNWKRGLPQRIDFADGNFKTALVDDNGWVNSITDEENHTTGYGYDSLGRINAITYPTDPLNVWSNTNRTFAPIATSEYGVPIGSWKQSIATGNYRKHIWFDALWRPILERDWDNASPSTTQAFVRRDWDFRGNEIFTSYPKSNITTRNDLILGTTKAFDALNRIDTETIDVDGELDGNGAPMLFDSQTDYDYLPGFETRIRNPRFNETRISYQAFDSPTQDFPTLVRIAENAPLAEQTTTTINRDVFGKVTSMTRSGNGASATRSMLYDAQQRLCQLTEPESGALVMAYDAAGNLDWSAEGRTPQGTCTNARNNVPASDKITRTYNNRNWLTHTNYPEIAGITSPDATNTYTPDGLLESASNANSAWSYQYNSRRALKQEALTFENQTHAINYSFDNLGNLSAITYPSIGGNFVNAFNPNALGQASQSASFISNASYHPNGSVASWQYGNGVNRTITQTTRQLPDRVRDVGSTNIFDEDMTYDINANVIKITDQRDNSNTRTLSYDAQDRLNNAQGVWGAGSYSYDGADNLKTQQIAGKQYSYNYTNQKLTSITDPFFNISFNYDAKGNQTSKLNRTYIWDNANRLTRVNGIAKYQYDAHGHRILSEKLNTSNVATGERTLSIYNKAGQLIAEQTTSATSTETPLFKDGFENVGAKAVGLPLPLAGEGWGEGGTSGKANDTNTAKTTSTKTHHYLGNTLVARREGNATTYLHTDLLGSVVAETNASQTVIKRAHYMPYGEPTTAINGPSYAGHVMDVDTGLVYMQQRYMDPDVGRFLTMDPKAPDDASGEDFNRYAYARNNPYKYVDPDGQAVFLVPLGIFIAKELAGEAFEQATGIPAPTLKNGGKFIAKQIVKQSVKNADNVRDAASTITKTAEVAKKADKATDVVKAKTAGRYEFPDKKADNTPYIGQSCNCERRLKQHEKAGRYEPGTEKIIPVDGGKTAREISEHKRIQEVTGGTPASQSSAVSNKVDPIGKARQHLLEEKK